MADLDDQASPEGPPPASPVVSANLLLPLLAPLTEKISEGSKPPEVKVREARLLNAPPWIRSLGKLTMEVATEGWRFPAPVEPPASPADQRKRVPSVPEKEELPPLALANGGSQTRLKPPADTVILKERLLYLLQPSL